MSERTQAEWQARERELLERNSALALQKQSFEQEANYEFSASCLYRNEIIRLMEICVVLANDIEETHDNSGEAPPPEVVKAIDAIFPPGALEQRVAAWVESRIGAAHMHPRERAMRLLEEALELAQAEGVALHQAERQLQHVYGRSAGEPMQEAGGVAVCLLGWCAARGIRLEEIALTEIQRIEAKPLDSIRGSLARKADADLVTCVETPNV